jgi:hypothetical protein
MKREIIKYKHKQPKSFNIMTAKDAAFEDIRKYENANYIKREYLVLKIKDVHNDNNL